jgi:ketosteroid isomerase-like protein
VKETTSDNLRTIIERKSRAFESAYAAHHARLLVESHFVDDSLHPIASPPGAVPPVRGRTSITEMFRGMFEAIPEVRLEIVELIARGGMAFELGRAHLGTADGSRVFGRYAVCWLHVGTDWRAQVDFFAADGWSAGNPTRVLLG